MGQWDNDGQGGFGNNPPGGGAFEGDLPPGTPHDQGLSPQAPNVGQPVGGGFGAPPQAGQGGFAPAPAQQASYGGGQPAGGGGYGGGGYGGDQPPGGGGFGGGGYGGGQPPGGGGFGGGPPPGGGGYGGGQPPGGPGAPPNWSQPGYGGPSGPIRSKLDVGDLLSTAASLVGRNFAAFAAVCVLSAVPGNAMQVYFSNRMQAQMNDFTFRAQAVQEGSDPTALLRSMMDMMPEMFAGTCASIFVTAILSYVAQAILMFTILENMAGRKPPVGTALVTGISKAPAVIGVALVVALIQFAASIPAMVLMGVLAAGGAAAGPEAGPLAILCSACCGSIFILISIAYVWVNTCLAVPASVVEGGVVSAITRGFELAKGNRWQLFFAGAIVMLVVIGVSFVGGMCSGGASAFSAFENGGFDPTTGMAPEVGPFAMFIQFLVAVVTSSVQLMMLAAVTGIAYARLRGIRDGVDAGALAEVFS